MIISVDELHMLSFYLEFSLSVCVGFCGGGGCVFFGFLFVCFKWDGKMQCLVPLTACLAWNENTPCRVGSQLFISFKMTLHPLFARVEDFFYDSWLKLVAFFQWTVSVVEDLGGCFVCLPSSWLTYFWTLWSPYHVHIINVPIPGT